MDVAADLSNDEIHVWIAALDQPRQTMDRLSRALALDEWQRARRLCFDRDRRRFIVRRGLRRAILARYLRTEPARLEFGNSQHGKPELVGDGISFNCSHSGRLALYAITRRHRIGIDVERMRSIPQAAEIARSLFSAEESRALCELPLAAQLEAFLCCWTRKEAYLKARGEGLTLALDQFVVAFAPGQAARLESVEGAPAEARRWSLRALQPAAGYVAAVAAEGDGLCVRCRWW